MTESIGIDIVETDRIRRALDRFGDRFRNRILGDRELSQYERRSDRAVFLAGRFACKEAVVKALGKYIKDRPTLSSIQIVNDDTGQPEVSFPDELAEQLKHVRFLVSISHEKHYAVAMAVTSETK